MGQYFLRLATKLSSPVRGSNININMKLLILLTASAGMVLADPHGSYAYTHIERPSYTLTQSWGNPAGGFASRYQPSRARSYSNFNSITYGSRFGSLRAGNFPTGADEPTARAARQLPQRRRWHRHLRQGVQGLPRCCDRWQERGPGHQRSQAGVHLRLQRRHP